MKRSLVSTFVAVLVTSAVAFSQAPPPIPKPGAEQKKLEYFAGSWKSEGDMKPGPMGPGGKFSGTTKGEMMDGGFFLLMHSEMNMAGMGDGKSVSVMGYNADDKKYTYHEFNSWGEAEAATGNVDGDTWTWNDENKMGGKLVRGRYTMKITSPTTYDFKYEVSDGTNYTTAMEGKATKQ